MTNNQSNLTIYYADTDGEYDYLRLHNNFTRCEKV